MKRLRVLVTLLILMTITTSCAKEMQNKENIAIDLEPELSGPLIVDNYQTRTIEVNGIIYEIIRINNLEGLINSQTREIIISPLYTRIGASFNQRNTNLIWLFTETIQTLFNLDTYQEVFSIDINTIISEEIEHNDHFYYEITNNHQSELINITDMNNPEFISLEEELAEEEIIEPEIPLNEQNTRNLDELRDRPAILLTFDDGPSRYETIRLLDALDERDARVTFFVLGENALRHPEIVARAFASGHSIGNHSFSHRNFVRATDEEIINEIALTNEIIYEITGNQNNLVRPPYGSINTRVLDAINAPIILWNNDPRDWENRDEEITYQNIITSVRNGSIVVLHDIIPSTIDASIRAIDTLLEQGYVFLSLCEALELGLICIQEPTQVRSLTLRP